MIWALFFKDMRLLGNYLRAAIVATVACYLVCAGGVIWLTTYQEPEMQSIAVRSFLSLRGGSNIGIPATGFFGALLAGSAFTLERSDRSAEFLACLPPSRWNHLMSKLSIVLGATMLLLVVHVLSTLGADLLAPYVRAMNYPITEPTNLLSLLTFSAVILSIIGGALATSAWLNSNGVPILCGLLTPLIMLSVVMIFSYTLGVQTDPGLHQVMSATTSSVLGASLAICGGYWYVMRDEP